MAAMLSSSSVESGIVRLNVGGQVFMTTRSTLENGGGSDQPTYFSALMSDAHTHTFDNGALFIDRDPLHFRHILNYLRDGVVPLERSDNAQQLAEILREAQFYAIDGLEVKLRLHLSQLDVAITKENSGEKEFKIAVTMQSALDALIGEWTSRGYDVLCCSSCTDSASNILFTVCFVKYLSRSQSELLDRLSRN